jgi:TRAP-type C4-dicarboxylate transport system permease large subunit
MIVLTMPILFPVMMAVGFDPIWFGVVSVVMSEVAFITPPVGMNVYVVAGAAPEVPLFAIFQGILPYLGALFVALALITIFPQICTFLPSLMK